MQFAWRVSGAEASGLDGVEIAIRRMARRVWPGQRFADQPRGLQAGRLRGVELLHDIRQKQDLMRWQADGFSDFRVRLCFALVASFGIEVAGKERGQIAGFQTAWLIREPLAWPNAPRHAVYRDFDAIQP